MKLGCIGFGNMAQAIVKGLLKKELIQKEDLIVSTYSPDSLKKIEENWQISGTHVNQDVIDASDVILLAVKPHQMDNVLGRLSIPQDKLVLSVAAGYPSDRLKQFLSESQYLRTMPNLNAQVEESMTAIVENPSVSEENIKITQDIFNAVGETVIMPENQLNIFIGLAGSSPALVFLFIDTLARSAVRYGMKKDTAVKIAAQAVLGSGKTVKHASDSPQTLIDKVSSPGGITVEAILHLLQSDFSDSVIGAFDKMIEKDQAMSGKQ
jgi:pyrroline-5-carboxylate reductase